MIGTLDDKNRQVIPRWLDYKASCALALLCVEGHTKGFFERPSSESRSTSYWEKKPSIATATDLVAESLILRNFESKEAQEAAQFILRNAPKSLLLLREIAQHFLEHPAPQELDLGKGQSKHDVWTQIASFKKAVRSYPFDPIAWSDLSLAYAIIGKPQKARQLMEVALSLGKRNRFILRSASRCFFHLGEPDYSLKILRTSDICGLDPWIASAEIAISDWMDRRSSCLSSARQLIRDQNFSPFSISELEACLGTLEIKNGSFSKGRALIRESLKDPSENALAQAEWANAQLKTNVHIPEFGQASYEAQARHFYRSSEFNLCIEATEKWSKFQPFSARPLILATFIASACLNDDRRAIAVIQDTASAHRNSPLLMNNLAFSLARSGDLDSANETLEHIPRAHLSDPEAFTIAATQGLLCFRHENYDQGRELYRMAVSGFDKLNDKRSAAIAAYFWAFEERRIGSIEANVQIGDAKKRIKQSAVFELAEQVEKL